jgi:hypothetical protein
MHMARNPMSRFEIFIGTWNTRGNVLATSDAPGSTLSATDTYRWLPGQRFIVHDVDARFGEDISRSMEVMGYDPANRKFVSRSYDDRGASEAFRIDLSRKRWRISGKTVRFDGKFDSDGNKLTGLWEIKSKKGRWQPWIELELVRA